MLMVATTFWPSLVATVKFGTLLTSTLAAMPKIKLQQWRIGQENIAEAELAIVRTKETRDCRAKRNVYK